MLTIHYDDGTIYRRMPLNVLSLVKESTGGTVHETVSGAALTQNELFLELLEQLSEADLPPVEPSLENYPQDMGPTVYYVLETDDGEKLFDVAIGWGNLKDDEDDSFLLDSVYFNGEKIPKDERFYTSIEMYLTQPHYLPGAFHWQDMLG